MRSTLSSLAKKHYENFPVGSWLIPKTYRTPIHLIYAFVRVADDLADEGAMEGQERIARLHEWEQLLIKNVEGNASDDFFREVANAIHQYHLPIPYFQDLMTAFRRDAVNRTYRTFDEVLDYCRHSANPIGRLLLILFQCSSAENEKLSDNICTALQLTNFWQDISVDTRRNRFYIPTVEMEQFGITPADLSSSGKQHEFRKLMNFQVERTMKIFEEGKPLLLNVSSEFRKELHFIYLGGTKILKKIKALQYDTRFFRPALTKTEKFFLALQSLTS
jgi:squalene synthase HpnC